MKINRIGMILLGIMIWGLCGCSCPRQGVYYLGDKSYAKDPETGKIRSWENRPSEEKRMNEYGEGGGAAIVTDILNCVVN